MLQVSFDQATKSVENIGLERTLVLILLLAVLVGFGFFAKWFRDTQRESKSDITKLWEDRREDFLKLTEDRRSDLTIQEKSIALMQGSLKDLAAEIRMRKHQ